MLQTLDRIVRNLFVRNLHLKVIALLLTFALYLWVSVDREVERTRYAPLRVDVPSEMVLVNDPPDKVGVTIRGKWSDLSQLDASQIGAIRLQVDPAMGRHGRISLTPDMVDLPPGLRAIDMEPSFVQFHLEKRQAKQVPVRAEFRGELPEGYKLGEVSVSPKVIEVSGPQNSLHKLTRVSTEPIDLTGHTESFTATTRPRLDDPLVEYQLGEPLEVSVPVDAQKIERTFSGLKVEPVNADASLVTSVKPTHVSVTFRGPKAVLDKLDRDEILASLDMAGQQPEGSETVEREVQIRNIPDGVELVGKQPRFFRVRLAPKAAQHAQD